MRLFNLSLLATFLSLHTFSQTDNFTVGRDNLLSSNSAFTSGVWIVNNEIRTTKGSVYLFDSWKTNAVLTTTDNKNLSIKGINYDTENDAFVAMVSGDSVYVFNNSNLKEVKINNRTFKYFASVEGGKGYNLEVLASNSDIEILKLNRKKIKEGNLNPLTQVKSPDRFIDDGKYFVEVENGPKEIKMNKSSFCRLFGDKSKDISKYMSNMGISVHDEHKFQTIFNYYNSL